MKKLYTFLAVILIGFIGKAQIVNIPDANFKAKLIALGIDTNSDGQIQTSEALAVTSGLSLSNANISDLTGVEAFTNATEVNCGYNNLNVLPSLNNLVHMEILSCSNNHLTSLNVSNSSLVYVYCNDNLLTSIDVSGAIRLNELQCYNNQLTTVYMKNGRNESWFGFSNNPNLQYICADDGQIVSIQSTLNALGYVNCLVSSYCTFVPGGTYYTVQGNNHLDENNNGCDTSDINVPDLKLAIVNGTVSGTLIPNSTGHYFYHLLAGTISISPILENPTYFSVLPTTANITFPASASPYTQDFCVSANGIHNDLEIVIIPVTIAQPGYDAFYKIIYKNKGTNTQSGTVNLVFSDSVLDYVSATPIFDTQTVNNLSWNFSNLEPFESREILVSFNLNSPAETPPLNGGNILNYSATVTGAIDESPLDNTLALHQTVLNGLDPNDKICLEGTTVSQNTVGKYVHYVIRFENSGTANVQNIVVKDIIDTTKYDINSLVTLSASASFVTRIINTNQVEFVFQNINLPFTAGSNDGYIAFKIKTKPTLVAGNTFSNSANIYFDYNFPIVTNTATTTIAALATQDFDFGAYFSVHPNPVKQVLNIETKATINVKSINIYNILGQMAIAIPNAESVSTINVSDLKTGTYFIKMNTDKGTANAKFIKE